MREVLLSHERFGRVFARMQRGHVAMILSTLVEGISRGEIDASIPPPLLLLSCIGLGALPQMVRRAAGDRAPFSMLPAPEKLAHECTELLFRAIGSKKKRPAATPPRTKKRAAVR